MPESAVKVRRLPDLVCKEHCFDLPLDYELLVGRQIQVFARELVLPENEKKDLPWLVYLEGGPGGQAPRPLGAQGPDIWIERALKEYRVLFLDQRGTGLSSRIDHESLLQLGSAPDQFEYLKHFRADTIVRDCEWIRKKLNGDAPWTVLGQSYGGFCLLNYLSFAPSGLKAAIFTGGLPALRSDPDDIYRATYKRVMEKNKQFYERYPDDIEKVKLIVNQLQRTQVKLPTGEILSPRRFLQLGIYFGYTGSFENMHYLLEKAFDSSGHNLSYAFLSEVNKMDQFNANILYSLLHEPCYCQGQAANWSADRILKEYPEFSHNHDPILFTGEMIYSWMFDEFACLRPLRKVADLLAEYSEWPKLYEVDALSKNVVPSVAVIYQNDMYVDLHLQEETAAKVRGLKTWITSEYEHNGIRQSGPVILDKLLAMLH